MGLAMALALLASGFLLSNLGLAGDTKQEDAKKEDAKKELKLSKELKVEDALTDQDAKDRVRTFSYCKTYPYKMIKGHTYHIDMKSTDLDSYLRLEDPAGNEVAKDDDSGGFPNARITFTAGVDGDFKIIATTFGGNATGKFTLHAVDKTVSATPAALKFEKGEASYNGAVLNTDLLYNGKRHKLLTIELEAGKSYQIDMKSKALDSYLFLEGPDGAALARDDDSGGFPDARIVHRAAKTGTYRIICTSFGNGLGDFNVTVRTVDQ